MASVHLDTHVVVWLYVAGEALDLLSAVARERIEAAERLLVSPMVLLELTLLEETGRIRANAHEIVLSLGQNLGLELAPEPFSQVVSEGTRLTWTRDPFDRLIAAQAVLAGLDLVTRDRQIRRNLPTAIW
ncbi:MAG: PIN domain-containing protein [Gemmatimonadota bacterium]|nr:PIN domain-containing protein [Gemmatimonadota bacterium]